MKGIKSLLVVACVVALAVIGLGYQALNQTISLPAGVDRLVYQVPEGRGSSAIANDLAGQGVIAHSLLMKAYVRLSKKDKSLKAGEYALNSDMNLMDVVAVLEQGKSIQYAMTIIEGWNFRELLAAINAHPQIKKTIPTDHPHTQQMDFVMQGIGEPELHPEGLFLPETYNFSSGTTDIQFLKRARRDMQAYLQQAWEQRSAKAVVKNPYEALILASIVEKETGAAHERPLIAGVFTNRLNIGMRLQTDPTVIYGMGEDYDGDIRFRDLRTPTPYNTYTMYGLPPTPIAMPGKHAIDAALNPQETEALYFVSRNDGTHIFSSTLKAHEAAVDKYQRSLR